MTFIVKLHKAITEEREKFAGPWTQGGKKKESTTIKIRHVLLLFFPSVVSGESPEDWRHLQRCCEEGTVHRTPCKLTH